MFSILSASLRNPGKQNYCSVLYVLSKTISKFYFLQFCPISFVKNISDKVCDYQKNVWHIFYAQKNVLRWNIISFIIVEKIIFFA